jgi:hypothetical protein
MPGVYRLKRCPNCDKEHRKKGNYCSQSCASTVNNTGREQSEETIEKITNTVNEYFQTPEGIATGHMVARQNTKRAEINQKIKEGHYILEPDDWAVEIPNFDDDDNIRL